MYSKEELLKMTEQAKARLEKQNVQGEDDTVDYYAEFREEFDETNDVEDKSTSVGVETYIPLKYEMDDDEYEEYGDIMEQASISNNEEVLFVGGPTKSELDGWKKKFENSTIYITEVMDRMFIFRTLNRFEYKQLIRQPNLDASQREEIICETTVLFPYDYNWRSMAKDDAGIPSTLSQIIMTKSGFTEEYAIERL